MISAGIAGLAGILISPLVPLVPEAYTLFIVPALAAAILGRFQGITIAVGGGLVIGMLQSESANLQSKYSWLPPSGIPELIPLVLILIVLVWRASNLPARGELITSTLGRAPRPRGLALPTIVCAAAAVVVLVLLHGSWRAAMVASLAFAIIALSQVVVTGFAGQVSLAQLVLAGCAGFLLSPLTERWGVPFPIALILAALGSMVVGIVVGLPAARIRGLPLAVVTLALAVFIEAFWFENTNFVSSNGANVVAPSLFGLNLGVGAGAAFPRLAFCFMVLVLLIIVGLGVAKLRTSRLGSAMLAVRANERSAAAAGINVFRTKLTAFAHCRVHRRNRGRSARLPADQRHVRPVRRHPRARPLRHGLPGRRDIGLRRDPGWSSGIGRDRLLRLVPGSEPRRMVRVHSGVGSHLDHHLQPRRYCRTLPQAGWPAAGNGEVPLLP